MHRAHPSSSTQSIASLALTLILFCSLTTQAQTVRRTVAGTTSEKRTAQYFEAIRKSPPQMLAFLRKMPKGGDLHSHLSGAVYAESYVRWAADKGLCVNQGSMTLSQPPCDQASGQVAATTALTN